MSLFIRYKNESDEHSGIGTMERHLVIFHKHGKFYWGQYSNNKHLFKDSRIKELRQEADKRIVFFDSKTEEIYVGYLGNIYSNLDESLDRNSIAEFVPGYYREELFKKDDSKVTAWLEISDIKQVFDESYIDNIYLQDKKNEKPFRESLKGQTSRFYIQNNNDFEIGKDDIELFNLDDSQCEVKEYLPDFENKKKFRQRISVVREGQQFFREKVLSTYNRKCCISGYNFDSVLEAAHVTPYNGKESNAIQNGLCLRSDIHKLWDRYLIAINPETYKVEVAECLNETEYQRLEGREVFGGMDEKLIPNRKLLSIQYDKFLKYKG